MAKFSRSLSLSLSGSMKRGVSNNSSLEIVFDREEEEEEEEITSFQPHQAN
jgi:hypothetical protein